MSHLDINSGRVVANASEAERAGFIRRTYLHVGGAIAAFTVLETLLVKSGVAESFYLMLGQNKWVWLLVMVAFMGVSYVADNWARSAISREKQYMGLGLFVIAEAIVFMPLLYRAVATAPETLQSAVIVTAALVAGITFTAFSTKINFSFLGRILGIGSFVVIGIIVAAILFDFALGVWFSGAMILFAGAAVIYSTSNIIHEYHSEQHVAAALSLSSSIGLLFWYVLQFMMGFGSD
jgi:FtsH-binding integral membrane protein